MEIEANVDFRVKLDKEMIKKYNDNTYENNQKILAEVKELITERFKQSFSDNEVTDIKVNVTFVQN